jgi:hypothetical protein
MRALLTSLPLAALGAALLASACGGDPSATSSTSTSGSGGSTTSTTTSTTASTSSSGGGGMGGSGGCVDMGPGQTTFVPAPADIEFAPVHPLPQGEQIVFNDWNASPNTVASVTPDGATTTEIFKAYRIWSLGISHDAKTIAFACGDPLQEMHYGIPIFDAIQHTWLYDTAAETATLLSDGNVNDECHAFGPGDTALFLCRRYDFTNCGDNKTYRIGRIDLGTKTFSFLSPEDPMTLALDPQPAPDGATLLFTQIVLNPPKQDYSLQKVTLPGGSPALLRAQAGSVVLSPDGTRYLYADYTDGGKLWVSGLDGSNATRIAPVRGTGATWSPDGTKVAYLSDDANVSCAHIDVVAADGSTATAPTRIRDCTKTNEFITQLAWIAKP